MATETTYPAVVDELFGIVKDAWEAGATAIVGSIPEIRWPGLPEPTTPVSGKFWARPSTQLVSDKQSSLSNARGKKRFRAVGLFYFQLFCPRSLPSRLDSGRQLARLIHSAFRKGSPSGSIQFRDQVIRELPPTDENYPINVVVTFEYDSVE